MRDGTRIFNAMIEVIEGAGNRRSRILHDRERQRGRALLLALLAAAARGVKVRVIADWAGSRETKRSFWRELREGGVDVRIFNKPGFRAWLGLLPRDHRKVLVADEEVCITGGIGLAEVWSGFVSRKKKRAPWRDTAVLIRGPAAAEWRAPSRRCGSARISRSGAPRAATWCGVRGTRARRRGSRRARWSGS